MTAKTAYIPVSTNGKGETIDLTDDVRKILHDNNIDSGIVTIFSPGSTAAVTTIEFEPGLAKDIKVYLDKFAPYDGKYFHHETWNDDNGSSHIQAAFLGPGLTVPVVTGEMTLGTWQQIVLVDCDTRPRKRSIVVQMVY